MHAEGKLKGTLALVLSMVSCTSTFSSSADTGASGVDGNACQSAVQCPPGSLCDPTRHTCETTVACATDSDCGFAAVCGSDNRCAPSKTGSPCTSTDNCLPGETCVGGFCGCKGQNYSAQSIPPNVLIVLDRSQSMTDAITGGTKWAIAKMAIAGLLAQYGDQIRFGLAISSDLAGF